MEPFVDLADTFHLPVVHLVDQPGFVIGVDAEQAATIRHGARALAAVYQAQVPWCSVHRAQGRSASAGAAHTDHAPVAYRAAWPSGDWGSLPLEGGIEAAYRAELEAAPDPAALRAEIDERMNAHPLAVPHRRGVRASRRSSTPATPGRSCASSPTSPRRCAAPAPSAWPHRG